MTDDDRTVRLLRETLAERAATVVDAAPVAVRSGPPTTSRRPLLAVAAAALVAVTAVGGVAAWRGDRSSPAAPRPAPVPRPTSVVPPDWKPVSALGIQIYVPPDWAVKGAVNEGCEMREPAARVVSRPYGGVNFMACLAAPKGTLVAFRPRPLEGELPGRTALTEGRTRITWVSPRSGAVVVASGADAALLQRVTDTARVVDVDAYGCPTDDPRPRWDRRRQGLPPLRLARADDLVACLYASVDDTAGTSSRGFRLVASARLDAVQASALVQAIDRSVPGAAPDRPKECAADVRESAYVVIRARAPGGRTPYSVHFDGCLDRYVAGPTAQSALTRSVLDPIAQALAVTFPVHELPEG